MRLITAVACMTLACAAPAAAQQPLGVVDGTLARFDPETLMPAGAGIESGETHTLPVLSPDGERFALGVSESGTGRARVGLWIGDPTRPSITHRVAAGIAAEAIVFPGVVAALLQDGKLVVVDPRTGAIKARREVGWSSCARAGVHAAGRGVIVNEVRANGAELVIVDARGRVSTRFVRLRPAPRRCVALVAAGDRAHVIGRDRAVTLDPVTGALTAHVVKGRPTTAAAVPGGVVVAGAGGARRYDAAWRAVWHDRQARAVLASGSTVVASGGGVRALDAATGRVLWRADGSAAAVAAGRVYAQPAVLDLATGERRGTHPVPNTRIRLVDVPEGRRAAWAGAARVAGRGDAGWSGAAKSTWRGDAVWAGAAKGAWRGDAVWAGAARVAGRGDAGWSGAAKSAWRGGAAWSGAAKSAWRGRAVWAGAARVARRGDSGVAGERATLAAQAAWPFERVTTLAGRDDDFELQGRTIYTRGAGPSIVAHPSGRRIRLPRGTQAVDLIRATPKALMVLLAGPNWRVLYGPRQGPLKRHRRATTVAAAVTGDTLLTVERDRRWIYARDVDGGPQRRLARVGKELSYMQAAGRYVAVRAEQKRLIVVDVRTGRIVYRVPARGFYRLSANGRIVVGDDEFERLRTATPRAPRLRTIVRARTGFGFAVAGDEIVFNERLSDSTSRLVLLTPDGRQRALTPRMRLGSAVAYDGNTLAFTAGRCVFKGPLPATTPTGTAPENCYPSPE